MAEKKREISFADLLKILGALAVFVPLMTAAVQYRQSVLQQQGENFRSIVEELSSEDEAKRLAAASKMGTFIEKDSYFLRNKNYGDAIDILVNRTSVELDYNVLNAIMGSLRKVKKSGYTRLIQDLLNIDRSLFIQEYAIEKWDKEWGKRYEKTTQKYFMEREELLKKKEKFKREKLAEKIDSALLANLEEEMKLNWNIAYKRKKNFNELSMHKQAVADTISSLLGTLTKSTSIEGLEFRQNSLNLVILTDVNLNKSTFKLSALSNSTIIDTYFDGSTIMDTVFTGSDLTKSSFKDCEITASLFNQATLKNVNFSGSELKDVFFTGSDLTGADFKGTKGLKPEYFYKAIYIGEAKFDNQELVKKSKDIKVDDFIKYAYHESKLSKQRKKEFIKSLYGISDKKEKEEIIRTLYKLLVSQERKELIIIFDMLFGDQKITDNYIKILDAITTK
ncbi:MAG: pentapeptide repeat-containing protein [Nitrospirae bacterium]|nr:pentapeptide repeat-containing protein [Nitrospirota bacterium]